MKRAYSLLLAILFLLGAQTALAKSVYKKQLKIASRSNESFNIQEMNMVIKWSATHLDDGMIEAQVHEYAKIYKLDSHDAEVYHADRLKDRGNGQMFFMSFYTDQKQQFGDLSIPKSQWRLVLTVDGVEYLPTRFLKVNKPGPLELRFYPYFIPWATGYYVWFDAPQASQSLSLSLHGPRGTSTLPWK